MTAPVSTRTQMTDAAVDLAHVHEHVFRNFYFLRRAIAVGDMVSAASLQQLITKQLADGDAALKRFGEQLSAYVEATRQLPTPAPAKAIGPGHALARPPHEAHAPKPE